MPATAPHHPDATAREPASERRPSWLPADGLPLTAFEEHMLLDDRPTHPMVIVSRFDFTGDPPVDALTVALETVLAREPLLTARVVRPRFGRPRWVTGRPARLHRSSRSEPPTGWSDATPPLPPLDPDVGPLLHAEVVEYPGGWSLIVAVHHAACDGLGLVGFVDRWLREAEGRPGRMVRGAGDVIAGLRGRGRVATCWRDFIRLLPRLAKGIAGVREFVSRRVVRLADQGARPPASAGDGWRPRVLVAAIESADLVACERRAADTGVMLNDLLAAAFISAVDIVARRAGGRGEDDRWIRLGVPMSLRTKSDYSLPAANRVSMVFLDRCAADCRAAGPLVAGVHQQMELIRSHSLGHIFPLSLEVGRLLPGGLARTIESAEPQATAVLSNLGRCFQRSSLVDAAGRLRVGSGSLASWWIVPPVRPGTALAAATHETGGRRILAVHVDEAAVTVATAAAILDETLFWLQGVGATPAARAPEPAMP